MAIHTAAALASIATEHTRTLVAHGQSATSALIGGYHLAFIVGAACIAVGALLAPFALRSRLPAESSERPEAAGRVVEPESQPATQAA